MNRLRKLEDHNRWMYENLVSDKTKEKITKIFNKDFKQKAVDELKKILKDCNKYDKELIELSKKKNNNHFIFQGNGKINVRALVNNPVSRENLKITLDNVLNINRSKDNFANNLQKYLLRKNKQLTEISGEKKEDERTKKEKKKNIFKQLRDFQKKEINENYLLFTNHANYYDSHLKEKYVEEFLKEESRNDNITEDYNNAQTEWKEVIIQRGKTYNDNPKETLIIREKTISMEKQENLYNLYNENTNNHNNRFNKEGLSNKEATHVKIEHSQNFNNDDIVRTVVDASAETRKVDGTENELVFSQEVPLKTIKETLVLEATKNNSDHTYLDISNIVNTIVPQEVADIKQEKDQVELNTENLLRKINDVENNMGTNNMNQTKKEQIDILNDLEPPSIVASNFNDSCNVKEKENVIVPSKNNKFTNTKRLHKKKISEKEIDTMYLNKIKVFEQINNTSLYSNIIFDSKEKNIDASTLTITSILSNLKAKKEKDRNQMINKIKEKKKEREEEENEQLAIKILHKKGVNDSGLLDGTYAIHKNSREIESVYIHNSFEEEKKEKRNENKENGKGKKNTNQLQQYQYLDSNNITIHSLSNHLQIEQEKIVNVCKYILDNENVHKYTKLEKEVAELICEELNVLHKLKYSSKNLKKRNPIVTILGHVDHGKTTLIDQIRNSNIAKNEVGGITQKLGAFEIVEKSTNRKITVLDTPGHSVFKKIRQRCVQCTDLIILVISVDDGIMSETIECIQLAKMYNIPLIIAANKIDKYNYDTTGLEKFMNHLEEKNEKWFKESEKEEITISDKFKKFRHDIGKLSKDLLNHDIITNLENGQTQLIPISAKMNINIDFLKKKILEVSDNLNLMSDFGSLCSAYILEKKVDPVKGKSITAICKSGTVKLNSYLLIGHNFIKVKKLLNADGHGIKEAYPSDVVQIFGTNSLVDDSNVKYGDIILEMSSLKSAQKMAKYKWKITQYNMLNGGGEESELFSLNWNTENKNKYNHKTMEEKEGKNDLSRMRENIEEKMNGKKKIMKSDTLTLPQIHLIIKTCDEGSIEAILEGINEYNNLKKDKFCDINNFIDRNYVNKKVLNDTLLIENLFSQWKPFKIVTKGIGTFNLNDLKYCQYIQPCFLIGFNIEVDQKIMNNIQNTNAVLRNHNIIYQLFDDLDNMSSFFFDTMHVYEPVARMVITKTGYYTIKKKKTKKTVIAVDIKEGTFTNKNYFSVLRNKITVHNKITIMSMQKNKQNTNELSKMNNDNAIIFNIDSDDFQIGDEIIAYKKGNRPPLFNKIKTFDLIA